MLQSNYKYKTSPSITFFLEKAMKAKRRLINIKIVKKIYYFSNNIKLFFNFFFSLSIERLCQFEKVFNIFSIVLIIFGSIILRN